MVRLDDLSLRDFLLAQAYGEGASQAAEVKAEAEAKAKAEASDGRRANPGTPYTDQERFFPGVHKKELREG